MSEKLQVVTDNSLAAMFAASVAEQNVNDTFAAGISSSDFLPSMLYRGKEWRTVVNGEEGKPMQSRSIEVFLVLSRPNLSKVFYAGEWQQSAESKKPDCQSSDGIYPDSSVNQPQAQNCQLCPHNAWGSGKQGKGKACSDYKLVVIVMANDPNMVFQLKVPAASLKPLGAYIKKLGMMGVPADGAVTRISFADTTHPQFEFDFVQPVQSTEQYQKIKEIAERSDVEDTLKVPARSVPMIAKLATHKAIQPVVIQPVQKLQVAPETTQVTVTPEIQQPQESPAEILAKWGIKS